MSIVRIVHEQLKKTKKTPSNNRLKAAQTTLFQCKEEQLKTYLVGLCSYSGPDAIGRQ